MIGLLVEDVVLGSNAEELGIISGDRLLSINGSRIRDIIDYHFQEGDDHLLLEIQKKDGTVCEYEIDGGTPLGIRFPAPLPAHCNNACIFCFVHQLPKGLRSPLYIKDEDYKLSFLYGNYVTLTNIKRSELLRIKQQRLSPLYISVHATNPELRETLLGRKPIPPIMDVMHELADAGITMHTQVVLCPGLNDGAEFERSVTDLAGLYPRVASIAVVPVGLTKHRKRLPELAPVTKEYATAFIRNMLPLQKKIKKYLGEDFLFFADEFYIKAGLPFPPLKSYGDLPQIENGIGMIPLFEHEAEKVLRKVRKLHSGKATVVTGMSALPFIAGYLKRLSEKTGVELIAVGVENRLFGSSVTVAGLVAGRDIIAALRDMELGDLVLVPDVMLKEEEWLFLDDLTIDDLEKAIRTPVKVVDSSPPGLYDMLKKEFGTSR